jgi:hypothetical protein
MDMRMAGVVVIDGDPIELRAKVGLDLRHQLAGVAGEVGKIGGVLGRDDEAELVAIVLAAIEEGVAIGAILRRRIELAALAVAGGAVALDIAQMRGGLAAAAGGANRAGFDDDAAAAGLAMAPAIRQVAGAHEGRAAPALHAAAGGDDALTFADRPGSPPLADRLRPEAACCWRAILRTLLRKLLAWPAFGASGADAAGPRPEAIVVVAHGRRSARNRRFGKSAARNAGNTGFPRLAAP